MGSHLEKGINGYAVMTNRSSITKAAISRTVIMESNEMNNIFSVILRLMLRKEKCKFSGTSVSSK